MTNGDLSSAVTPADLEYWLQTHDLRTANPCTLKENRFKQKNVFIDEIGKMGNLYCWRGIIHTHRDGQPDCVIGSVCDPYSYTGARTRFCVTWQCPEPYLYVGNEGTEDAGIPVINERGGTVVYNKPKECEGAFIEKLGCVIDGFRQSLDNVMHPARKSQVIKSAIVWAGALLVIGFVAMHLRTTNPKALRRIEELMGRPKRKHT